MLLHHISVEILVLQRAGRLTGEVCYPRYQGTQSWMHTREARIEPAAAGQGTKLTFTNPQAEQHILQAIPEELPVDHVADEQALFSEVEHAVAQGASAEHVNEAKEHLPSTWSSVSIKDPSVKMAVCTRPPLKPCKYRSLNLIRL